MHYSTNYYTHGCGCGQKNKNDVPLDERIMQLVPLAKSGNFTALRNSLDPIISEVEDKGYPGVGKLLEAVDEFSASVPAATGFGNQFRISTSVTEITNIIVGSLLYAANAINLFKPFSKKPYETI